MRFLHLADLHLGKRLKEYPLIKDQRFVLKQAVDLLQAEHLDGVFLSGDIYDSSVPSAEATTLFDDFITAVNALGVPLFIISGNHDSSEKLEFGGRIFSKNGIYVSTNVKSALMPINYKGINIYLLPFIKPIDVNDAFKTSCKSYSEALQEVITRMAVDPTKTNILLAHQMVLPSSGPLLVGGSESSFASVDGQVIGDITAVPASLFAAFDYVALGHVHRPETIASNARYPGSILKYHKDEAAIEKLFTIVNIDNKKVTLETRSEKYLHDVVVLKGTLDEILHAKVDEEAYIFAVLKDTVTLDDPMGKLRARFKYAASVEYERLDQGIASVETVDIEHKSKEELFGEFFDQQNGKDLDPEQKETIHSLLTKEDA